MAEEQNSLRTAIDKIVGNLGTASAISNTPFDPNAEANAANAASLASIKAQSDALAAQVTPVATTLGLAPAQAARKPNYSMSLQDWTNKLNEEEGKEYYAAGGTRSWGPGTRWGKIGQTYKVDPATGDTISPEGVSAGKHLRATWSAPTVFDSSGKIAPPVNPGSKAPWQASQAYWQRLADYNKTQGK